MTELQFLIRQLKNTLEVAFKTQKIFESMNKEYDEDYICELKSEFINKYSSFLTEDQIDYISKI